MQKEKKLMALESLILEYSQKGRLNIKGAYLHYKNVPKKIMFERSIVERIKLRRGRLDEIKRKEQNINHEFFNAYFTGYQNPSSMYKKLSETEGEVNETRVDSIKKVLSKLKRIIEHAPKADVFKIDENEKIIDVAKKILEFNNKIQSEQRLKIAKPNQMLNRLQIFLAQLNAENNSERLKNGIRQLLHSLFRSTKKKKLQKISLDWLI